MFTVQQFLCEIHVDPLMGTSTLKAACATPYKGHKWSTMGRELLE